MDYVPVDINSVKLDEPPPDGYVPVDMSKITLDTPPPLPTSDNINADYGKRLQQAGDIVSGFESGKLNPVGAALGTASTGLGLVKDVGADIAKGTWNALPNVVTSPIEAGAGYLKDQFMKTPEGVALGLVSPVAKQQYNQFASANPNTAQGLNLAGNVAATLPVASGVEGAAKLFGDLPETGGAFVTPGASILPIVQKSEDIAKTTDALRATKSIAYDNAKTLGAVLTPAASDHVSIMVPQQVENELGYKLDDKLHPQTIAMLNNLQKKTESGMTTNDLENVRIGLNKVISGSPQTPDAFAAKKAKDAIDNVYGQIEQNPDMLTNKNPAAMQAFRDARYANGVYQRHAEIGNIISDARSNPAKIQKAFQKLVSSKNENDFNLYSPDEQAMIENIAYPKGVDTALEGGGLGNKLMHGAGLGAKITAGALMGGEFGGAWPVIGGIAGGAKGSWDLLSDAAKQARVLKGADDVQKLIASKAKVIETPESAAFRAKLNGGKQ